MQGRAITYFKPVPLPAQPDVEAGQEQKAGEDSEATVSEARKAPEPGSSSEAAQAEGEGESPFSQGDGAGDAAVEEAATEETATNSGAGVATRKRRSSSAPASPSSSVPKRARTKTQVKRGSGLPPAVPRPPSGAAPGTDVPTIVVPIGGARVTLGQIGRKKLTIRRSAL